MHSRGCLVQVEINNCHYETRKLGSCLRVGIPAVAHDGVEWDWTALLRDLQPQPLGNKTEYLLICDIFVRQSAKRKHLPAEHAKGPCVAVESEFSCLQDLRWHPPHREELFSIVIIVLPIHIMPDAQIGHFNPQVGGHDAAACSKVPMDDSLGGKVSHTICNLLDNV